MFRTKTVWKSLNPVWGEDYTLHLPGGFREASFYVYDEDIVSGDDVIGSFQISKEDLKKYNNGKD